MSITGPQNRFPCRVPLDLVYRIVAVVDLQNSSPGRAVETLQFASQLRIGNARAVGDQPQILFALLFIQIEKSLAVEKLLRRGVETLDVPSGEFAQYVLGNAVSFELLETRIARAGWNVKRPEGRHHLLVRIHRRRIGRTDHA